MTGCQVVYSCAVRLAAVFVPTALRFSCQGPSRLREAKRAMGTRMDGANELGKKPEVDLLDPGSFLHLSTEQNS